MSGLWPRGFAPTGSVDRPHHARAEVSNIMARFIDHSYPALAARAALGFLAAAISVLTFHAAAWWVLHLFGMMPAPYPLNATAPLGVPLIASLTFWGALYGIPFGLAMPRLPGPLVVWGFALGILACLVGWFIVAPLKGAPPVGGSILKPIIINGTWGVGVALIAPPLMSLARRRSAIAAG
jgi:hypothetical protein